LMVVRAEVHKICANHIPAEGSILQNNSRLLCAHIDHIKALIVLYHQIGEGLIVIVGERLETAVIIAALLADLNL
jgi:hypothetical protein